MKAWFKRNLPKRCPVCDAPPPEDTLEKIDLSEEIPFSTILNATLHMNLRGWQISKRTWRRPYYTARCGDCMMREELSKERWLLSKRLVPFGAWCAPIEIPFSKKSISEQLIENSHERPS
jgi:hypothetical protein